MKQLAGRRPRLYGFVGGGSTGYAAAGFLDAVQSGRIPWLKPADVEVFAVVGTADDGSRTGDLRRLYGIPAVGDLRRTISALSACPAAAAIFEKRFGPKATAATVERATTALYTALSHADNGQVSEVPAKSSLTPARLDQLALQVAALGSDILRREPAKLHGLTLGHLFLAAITLEHGDIDRAAREVGQLLAVRGQVVPVSRVPHRLVMQDGPLTLQGEHAIDIHTIQHPSAVKLLIHSDGPSPRDISLNPRADRLVRQAAKVTVVAGSVYTSKAPVLHILRPSLQTVNLSLIGNLVTEDTETRGWAGERYVTVHEEFAGRKFDEIIYNDNTAVFTDGRALVFNRDQLQRMGNYRLIAANLVQTAPLKPDPNDPLTNRSRFRHDMTAVAIGLASGLPLDNPPGSQVGQDVRERRRQPGSRAVA